MNGSRSVHPGAANPGACLAATRTHGTWCSACDGPHAVMETVARSLGMALEGALSAQALKDRTRDLERSNAELKKFAYVASHDRQEPLRTITGFSEIVERRCGSVLDERGRMYLGLARIDPHEGSDHRPAGVLLPERRA